MWLYVLINNLSIFSMSYWRVWCIKQVWVLSFIYPWFPPLVLWFWSSLALSKLFVLFMVIIFGRVWFLGALVSLITFVLHFTSTCWKFQTHTFTLAVLLLLLQKSLSQSSWFLAPAWSLEGFSSVNGAKC